jgi:hypothetical protein
MRRVAASACAQKVGPSPSDPIDRDLVQVVPDPGPAAVAGAVRLAATALRGSKPEGVIVDEASRTGREIHVRADSVPAASPAATQTDRQIGGYRMTEPNRVGGSDTGRARLANRTAGIASPSRAVGRTGRRSTARIGHHSIVRTGRRSTEPEGLDPPALDALARARRSPGLARRTQDPDPARLRVRGRPGRVLPAGPATRPSSAIAARRLSRLTTSSTRAKSWSPVGAPWRRPSSPDDRPFGC